MRYNLCAILDAKLGEYGPPMAFQKSGQAVRQFGDEVQRQDKNNQMYTHPEDFTLWHVGDYESETGEVFTQAPRLLASASEYKV